MQKKTIALLSILAAQSLFAKRPLVGPSDTLPWMTGPILSSTAHVTKGGNVNFEPFYFLIDYNGDYNSDWHKIHRPSFWVHSVRLYTTIGLTDWMDFACVPIFLRNESRGQSANHFSDLATGFDFQLLNDTPQNHLPALKLGIREVFPIGKYDQLDPKKRGTDIGGEGNYQSVIILCASRTFHLRGESYLVPRLSASYWIFSRVHVRGHNLYGGVKDTDGHVYPGQSLEFDLSYEVSLNKNWVITCDHVLGFVQSTKFKGHGGTDPEGNAAKLSDDSKTYFWMAPAIEYNWNENFGFVTGSWFSMTGRNTRAFDSWVSAFNINF